VRTTKGQIAAWRAEIVRARIALADEDISRGECLELWSIVDSHEALIKLSNSHFPSEMEQVDRELEAALRRSK
jgi:hypothetical protein